MPTRNCSRLPSATISKDDIRSRIKARRRALTKEERAGAAHTVCQGLFDLALRCPVAAYLAGPSELDLTEYLVRALAEGVSLAVPRWDGVGYRLAALKSLDAADLRAGPMGILEPAAADWVASATISTWLVPGLAFTHGGDRLGYGGGWYDRLLASADPNSRRYGVAFACQIVEELPVMPHDVRMTGLAVPGEHDFCYNMTKGKEEKKWVFP